MIFFWIRDFWWRPAGGPRHRALIPTDPLNFPIASFYHTDKNDFSLDS
jgi:hypothetical protein